MLTYQSWGRTRKASQALYPVYWRSDRFSPPKGDQTLLPYGLGRSYGDSCLNDQGILVPTRGLNRLIELDQENGLVRCEAGVTLEEILRVIVPRGWFLPVTPGTKFVTVGGAIANDIHGKNHHRAGTFGCHLARFELARSDGSRILCSPHQNPDWHRATIGGLGLTGLILWAEFRLKRIGNAYIEEEIIKFKSLEDFLRISAESDSRFEYTVAWIDCLSAGRSNLRGLFLRGNHARTDAALSLKPPAPPKLGIPLEFPSGILNRLTVRIFNTLYYHEQGATRRRLVHFDPFFYPLDAVNHWNRIYGRQGFFQYQFVVPRSDKTGVLEKILDKIARSRETPFLSVLKVFGDVPSPGLLSFPREGITLALDFPNRGKKTLALFEELDRTVAEAGGAVYPAKDGRMSARNFQKYYPQWKELERFRDPKFSSSFWRRVAT